MTSAPIIILGAPRTGTSILADILAVHADVHFVTEPRLTWKYGNDGRSDWLEPRHATPEVRQHIATRLEGLVAASGRRRLLEKTPANALRPGFVRAVFPDSRLIHITRSGYHAVASIRSSWVEHARRVRVMKRDGQPRVRERLDELSWRRRPRYISEFVRRAAPEWMTPIVGRPTWGPILPGMRAMMAELSTLEIACLQWRMCTERAAGFGRHSEGYLEVKLEELDEAALERIVTFAGLEHGVEGIMHRFDHEFDVGRLATPDPLVEEEKGIVAGWIEPTMHWLGYA